MIPQDQADSLTWLGARLMMTTAPLARTVIGIPAAAAAFLSGWALTRAAHALRCDAREVDPRPRELDEATAELLG
jgi:hypothetical protein